MTFENIIETKLQSAFNDYRNNYDHETEDDYAPYGDTEVCRGSFITDESMDKFADSFKESMSIDAILEVLKTDDDFCSAVNEMIEYIAKNREV